MHGCGERVFDPSLLEGQERLMARKGCARKRRGTWVSKRGLIGEGADRGRMATHIIPSVTRMCLQKYAYE